MKKMMGLKMNRLMVDAVDYIKSETGLTNNKIYEMAIKNLADDLKNDVSVKVNIVTPEHKIDNTISTGFVINENDVENLDYIVTQLGITKTLSVKLAVMRLRLKLMEGQ